MSLRVVHGDLYAADLNPRFGTEPGKARPVLVIQTDLLNEAEHPSTWVIPCTAQVVGDNPLRVHLPKGMAGNSRECDLMIDQSRAIDNRRLKRRIGTLPAVVLREVKTKLRSLGDL
jgi:mRNA interferase MazF